VKKLHLILLASKWSLSNQAKVFSFIRFVFYFKIMESLVNLEVKMLQYYGFKNDKLLFKPLILPLFIF